MSIAIDIESLWHEYHDRLLRQARRHVDENTAEDIVQDVFVRALRAMRQGNGASVHVSGWLFRIARNLTYDYYRHVQVMGEQVDLNELSREDESDTDTGWYNRERTELTMADGMAPHEWAEHNEYMGMAQRALDRLTELQQQALALRVEHELDYRSIGAVMGTGEDAPKQLVTRARASLRRYMREAA